MYDECGRPKREVIPFLLSRFWSINDHGTFARIPV